MTALEQAYAINTETPLLTVEFRHPSLTNGVQRFVQDERDFTAITEIGQTVTFVKSGMRLSLPSRDSEGTQTIGIQIANTSNEIWREVSKVADANRINQREVECIMRAFLPSNINQPAGAPYPLVILSSSINRVVARLDAAYAPLYDTVFPKGRYYPSIYNGLKYV